MSDAFKLVARTPEQWIKEFCQDGDTLKVHVLSSKDIVIQNERDNSCYFFKEPENTICDHPIESRIRWRDGSACGICRTPFPGQFI